MGKILVLIGARGSSATVITDGAESTDVVITNGSGGYRTKSLRLALQSEATITFWDRFFTRTVRFSKTVHFTTVIPASVDLTPEDVRDYLDATDVWPRVIEGDWQPLRDVRDLGPATKLPFMDPVEPIFLVTEDLPND